MQVRLFRVLAVLSVIALAATASAQFGHPLKGTWSGDWGPDAQHRTHVVLELNWDGKTLSGIIDPGPDAVPMKTVTLDPSDWKVHIEAEDKKMVHYVIDGTVENLGAYSRFISGTWTEGSEKGTFKVTRN